MNENISMAQRIRYMVRMKDWYEWVLHIEDVNDPILWKYRGSSQFAKTNEIISYLNGRIKQYSIGVSKGVLERDSDSLNFYREFYNRNRGKGITMGSLITTI
jgi:hypothetical protein